MKKILPLVKANLLSLVLLVIAAIALPVLWFFSSGWHSSINKGIEKQVRSDLSKINSVDVTYTVPAYLATQEEISVKMPPNSTTTSRVASLLSTVRKQISEVEKTAIDFNSHGKVLLIGGDEVLFPEPTSESARLRLLDEFIDIWPAAHKKLLESFDVRDHPAEAVIRTQLERLKRDEEIRLAAGRSDASLTEEERKGLTQRLGEHRLQLYRAYATSTRFFATPDVFEAVVPWDRTVVLPMETAWEWQHLYWIHQDIIAALAQANSDGARPFVPVHEGPVKRLLSVRVSPLGASGAATPSASRGGRGGDFDSSGSDSSPPEGVDVSSPYPETFAIAHTGRAGWPDAANTAFDTRYVDIDLIAAADKLPQLIAAFPKVNFMTVIGMDIEDYDPVPDLKAGFDYGPDPIVRVSLRIETIWLRSWIGAYMPKQVRQTLGIPDPTTETDDPDAQESD